MDPILEVKDLKLQYGRRLVLDVPALRIHRGEVLALIGPNGAGKSSFLLVLALLQRPTAGEVYFNGAKVVPRLMFAIRRRMAMVFQEPLLLDMTVYDNVALGLRMRRLPAAQVETRVRNWLDRLGIGHLAGRHARELSGGEAQRASLARAFVLEPEVIFLDEPFASLDAPTRYRLLRELRAMLVEMGITAVFVTHDFAEVPHVADRVAAMLGGRVEQMGSPAELLARPASHELAMFLGLDGSRSQEEGWAHLYSSKMEARAMERA